MDVPETNLGNIIEKIKSEGVDEAKRKSDEIIKEASERASHIIDEAKEKAEMIIDEAGREIEKREGSLEKAIELAARDAVLHVRASITGLLDAIVKKTSSDFLTGECLEKVLFKVIEGWSKKGGEDITLEVFLGDEERKGLSETFLSHLNKELKTGVELKVHPDIERGFRIGEKGGHLYYDFTDDAIAELLALPLKGELAGIFDKLKRGNEET